MSDLVRRKNAAFYPTFRPKHWALCLWPTVFSMGQAFLRCPKTVLSTMSAANLTDDWSLTGGWLMQLLRNQFQVVLGRVAVLGGLYASFWAANIDKCGKYAACRLLEQVWLSNVPLQSA